MSYYEPQGWQAPVRQASWEQPPPPSRSGASSTSQRDDSTAFGAQLEEVDRAIDNLVKSGKLFSAPSRRDSIPMMMGQRPYSEYDPRAMGGAMSGIPQRHHSISEYDPARSHSASNLQSFYAAQRYQPRPSEAEQMMQAKRRMAAQRERELRNYHQEQQYNRTLPAEMSTNKSDRSMSPSAMSEEGRRDLIARQHRALYGNESTAFFPSGGFGDDNHTPRPDNQGSNIPVTSAGGIRGPSPRAIDPFGMGQSQGQGITESASQSVSGTGPSPSVPQQRSRSNSTSSPSTGNNPAGFGMFDNTAQQSSHTSTSSPSGESPNRQATKSATAPIGSGMGPIGTRPIPSQGGQAPNPALNKRSTTPLPSPLGYGFAPNEAANANERSTSAASNPSGKETNVGLGWGNTSGVWGSKNSLGVQASVWG